MLKTLKSNLSKSNTSLTKLVVSKSKFDETLGAQIIGKKSQALDYTSKETNYINTPKSH